MEKSDCAEYTPGKDWCMLKQDVLERKKTKSWKIMANNCENLEEAAALQDNLMEEAEL